MHCINLKRNKPELWPQFSGRMLWKQGVSNLWFYWRGTKFS